MQIVNGAVWAEIKRQGQAHPLGADYAELIERFTEAWANIMETLMLEGRPLHEIAAQASFAASAAMAGMSNSGVYTAACFLANPQIWPHAQAFRAWYEGSGQAELSA